MKNLKRSILIVFATASLFSCSKKVQTFQFGNQPYLPASTQNNVKTVENTISANTETNIITESPVNEAIAAAKLITTQPSKTQFSEKPNFKQRVLQKVIAKKIQKLEKKGGLDDKMKLGIVIALIGLLFIVIGSLISNLLGFLGVLALLIGLVIILLVALDMI